jgi:hypothetical protein
MAYRGIHAWDAGGGDFKERLQKKGTELDGFYALYIVLQEDLGRR